MQVFDEVQKGDIVETDILIRFQPPMLSQTAEYALRAAVYLAEVDPEPRTARQIAEAIQVPPGYLSKVLQALSRAGLVQSQRGLGGGFRLEKPATELTVLDIIRVVDPFRRIRSCPLELPEHADQLCPLHQQLDDAMAAIEASFRSATIADMVRQPDNQGRPTSTFCSGTCEGSCGSASNNGLNDEARLNGSGRPPRFPDSKRPGDRAIPPKPKDTTSQ